MHLSVSTGCFNGLRGLAPLAWPLLTGSLALFSQDADEHPRQVLLLQASRLSAGHNLLNATEGLCAQVFLTRWSCGIKYESSVSVQLLQLRRKLGCFELIGYKIASNHLSF